MPSTHFQQVRKRLDARINWERRDRSTGWRVDLDPIRDLLVRLGSPESRMGFVHVAGSKGKGSVASLIATSLGHAGLRVGRYGSPHVESITERVRIGGMNIGEEAFARALVPVLDAVESAELQEAQSPAADASWFDIMTAAALLAFQEAEVEIAVLEVGLGGRLDSTNVIPAPLVAVVTTIALEHTEILGDTHGKIAREKGGIVKPGSHFVSGCDPDSEAGLVLAAMGEEHGAIEHVVAFDHGNTTFEAANVAVARAVLEALRARGVGSKLELTPALIQAARLPGRMERGTIDGVPVVVDGAHVAESVAMALAEARLEHPGPCFVVAALHREKKAGALMAPIFEHAAGLFLTTVPSSGVHRPAEELLGVCQPENHRGIPMEAQHDPSEAVQRAVQEAQVSPGAWVFITGSLYLVGAIRGMLR